MVSPLESLSAGVRLIGCVSKLVGGVPEVC